MFCIYALYYAILQFKNLNIVALFAYQAAIVNKNNQFFFNLSDKPLTYKSVFRSLSHGSAHWGEAKENRRLCFLEGLKQF